MSMESRYDILLEPIAIGPVTARNRFYQAPHRAIGDCHAPGLLSEAVFSGHEAARLLDGPDVTDLPFRIEQVPASWDPPLPWTN